MFEIIDGGFQVTINGLFTINLSWLFCFCGTVSLDIAMFGIKVINWVKTKAKKTKTKENK